MTHLRNIVVVIGNQVVTTICSGKYYNKLVTGGYYSDWRFLCCFKEKYITVHVELAKGL